VQEGSSLGPTPTGQRTSRAGLILALYGGLAALALLIGALRGDPDVYRLPHSTTLRLILSPLLGVAIGLVVVFLTRLAVHRFDWARQLHRSFRGLLGNLHARDIFILAVASSVGEELLFRGALLPWVGLLAQAVIFALLHVGPGLRYLPWTASALVMGLALGLLHQEMGDLGGPIAAHFTINYLNLGYIVRVELPES
jgi:membrane protease YdiL (CAAX protease family)